MTKMTSCKYPKGFTLVELMAVVGIAAIMVSLAVPNLSSLIMNGRRTAQVNEFVLSMTYAKSEAVKRGVPVTVCSKSQADETCSGDTDWDYGWLVFTDIDGDGGVDPDDQILRVRGTLEGGNSLRADALTLVTFQNTGFPVLQPNQNTSINLCDTRGVKEGRLVTISQTGRAAISQPASACP